MMIYYDTEPEKFAMSTCLYKDDQGNLFRIYISAPTKQAVIEFINEKLKTNEVKIKVDVLELRGEWYFPELVDPDFATEKPANEPIIPTSPPQLKENESFVLDYAPIRIGISRVTPLNVTSNYRIVYDIDPPLAQGQEHKDGFNDDFVELQCECTVGRVEFSLWEKRYAASSTYSRRRLRTISAGQSIYVRAKKHYTGEWLFNVKGVNAGPNTYRLIYARAVF